ncbi:MAG TPA: GH3 auxin-responsive promoter family protein [Thermoanaerobaculia bacterium]|nr:GH3 auxin-responsive promoter family protein [Thermoanaerobaculia bacterium]
MKPLCVGANGAWIASSLPAALAFETNLHRVAEVQEEVLLRILRRNAQTEFGRAHGFASIRSVREYQERVPVRTYDEYAELRGDARALTASPITHYETTSGSSGATKRIPYTRDLRAEMGRAIAPWVVGLFREHPGAFAGEAYWSISPVLGSDPHGLVGSDPITADEDYLGPFRARLVRAVRPVPADVRFIQDVEIFRGQTLDHLLRRRTLSLISVWHPSFLLLLLGSDPERMAEAWPHLRVISCWSDANAARDAAELARIFPRVHIQPKGLLSTEGFVSIPIADAEAPALAYRSHFYELRCLQTDRVLPASEGQVWNRYRVVLTTGGGLYRYDTEDLVEIVGFRETCPLLRFVGRAQHVSDHYGEKLNEVFVRERLEVVLQDLRVQFAMVACEESAYVLFVQCDADGLTLIDVARRLDDAFRENVHYDYCRRLGQLAGLGVFRVGSEGSKMYLALSGQRLGGVKLPALDRRQGWSRRFDGCWVSR